jgi:hypothetical protein
MESIKERRLLAASLSAFVDLRVIWNCPSETDMARPAGEAGDGSPGAAGDETNRRVR